MTALRRFLVFQLFLLWQGGFLFYSAVVVPAGTEVLGTPAAQGAITARVTDSLNYCGIAALAVLCWDLSLTRDPSTHRTAVRWWLWTSAALAQYVLLFLHVLLDYFMSPDRLHVIIGPPFRPVHRIYLWMSTGQWLAGLALAWYTLRGWRGEDRLI